MKLVRSAVAINVRWAANAICGDDCEESHRILRASLDSALLGL